MNLTIAQLSRVMPSAPVAWLRQLELQLPMWSIDSEHELASFLAQIAHESRELTRLEEDLSYAPQRLLAVWPRRFPTIDVANQYAHDPEKLANFVYFGRLGNVQEGDGWRYHGRGPLQITGRRNYSACAADLGEDVIRRPELLLTPAVGIRSACWYWWSNNLDLVDDDDDVTAETKKINGGTLGLAERQAYFTKALTILTEAA